MPPAVEAELTIEVPEVLAGPTRREQSGRPRGARPATDFEQRRPDPRQLAADAVQSRAPAHDEGEELDERRAAIDATLARFSAVHDEIVADERARRKRIARLLPWANNEPDLDEVVEAAEARRAAEKRRAAIAEGNRAVGRRQLRGAGAGKARGRVVVASVALAVVGTGAALTTSGGGDQSLVSHLMGKTRDGDQAASSGQPRTASPSAATGGEVRIQVLNASGRDGLARSTANSLTDAGYSVVRMENTRTIERTVVRHSAQRTEQARTLAAGVPGAVLEEDPAMGGAIALVLGTGFDGAITSNARRH